MWFRICSTRLSLDYSDVIKGNPNLVIPLLALQENVPHTFGAPSDKSERHRGVIAHTMSSCKRRRAVMRLYPRRKDGGVEPRRTGVYPDRK